MQHDNGTQTVYGHASKLLVTEGQSVVQGQKIALVGSTGESTGPHLHVEVRGGKNPF
jgi:murein DD-endopeptidase MepM/ murein hydrolase activator NlpD